jgi:hypothetical protein
MAYLKSALVGLIALVLSAVLYLVWLMATLPRPYLVPPGAEIALDLRAIISRPSFWLTMLLAFAAALYWEFRRASH